jgi:hypothetical protein
MKKIITIFILLMTLTFSTSSHALDPKLKMVGTMAGYGVVGGALLGTASMAFGAGGRAIAKGASLGLYAGIIFGSYVILNYELKKRGFSDEQEQNQDYYPDATSPYEEEAPSGFIQLEDYQLAQFDSKVDIKSEPLFFMNFVNIQF